MSLLWWRSLLPITMIVSCFLCHITKSSTWNGEHTREIVRYSACKVAIRAIKAASCGTRVYGGTCAHLMGSANGFAPIGGSDGVVSMNRIFARLSPEEFALRGRREERSGRNVVLVACLSPAPGQAKRESVPVSRSDQALSWCARCDLSITWDGSRTDHERPPRAIAAE